MSRLASSSSRPMTSMTSGRPASSAPSASASATVPAICPSSASSPPHLLRAALQSGSPRLNPSCSIDTIDPSMAPATGTPESGGWTTREVKKILRGLSGLNMVGADVVEVSPAYDTNAELTGMVAADLVQEFLNIMIKKGPRVPAVTGMKFNLGQEQVAGVEIGHDEL